MSAALKPAWVPRIVTVDAIVPGCRFHVGSGVENFRISQFGGEREFTQQIIDEIAPGETLFDIGSCVGFVAVHAGQKGANVVAFEPEPGIRRRLLENIELNGLPNVRVMDWAVADRAGTATLFTDGAHGNSPSLAGDRTRSAIEIRTGSIDDAIAARLLPAPQVIKLDIEGAEVRAVRGMKNLLAGANKPRSLFVEVHPPFIEQMGDDLAEFKAILTASGYGLASELGRYDQLHQIWHAR